MSDAASDPSETDFTRSNRQTYDRIAHQYADQVQLPSDAEHWLTDFEDRFVAALPHGGIVADVGCGPAYDGLRLAGRGARVLGIDLSAGMLDVAGAHLDGRLIQGDMRMLPFASDHLDGIWSVASMLHVPDQDTIAVLAEFKRVMKPAGWLVLVTVLGDDHRHEPVPYAPDESRWFVYRDPDTLRTQLAEVGLEVRLAKEVRRSRRWWMVLATSA